ncbi:MAG: iron ABC transporter permease [Eggerthellales bacterium]|nr:iron ABC transporter permease [Eggerthellales bacterium]
MAASSTHSSVQAARRLRTTVVFIALTVILLALLVLNVCIGSVPVPVEDLFAILFNSGEVGFADLTMSYKVVWQIRLPRIIAATVLGGGLALSGFLLQTFFNNPIAGPYILGISSGAKLIVAIVMIMGMGQGLVLGSWALILAAFVGAMLSMAFVLAISHRIRSMGILIVAGVMVGYICSAITEFFITFASDQNIANLHNWSVGSFSGIGWNDVSIMVLVVLVASAITFGMAKPISAYQLGESYSQSMGVNIKVFRVLLILLSSLLAATVTAFAGPVSFVGIAVPHLIKSFLKSAKPLIVIPACFLGGAIFCLGCDLIARTIFAPTELSISAVTAVFGAPVVIALMLKRRQGRD